MIPYLSLIRNIIHSCLLITYMKICVKKKKKHQHNMHWKIVNKIYSGSSSRLLPNIPFFKGTSVLLVKKSTAGYLFWNMDENISAVEELTIFFFFQLAANNHVMLFHTILISVFKHVLNTHLLKALKLRCNTWSEDLRTLSCFICRLCISKLNGW